MSSYPGEILYRVLVEGIVNLEPPLCPDCEGADGMYVLAQDGEIWFLEIQDRSCGYTRMALTFERSEAAELKLYSSARDYHRFVARGAGPDDREFACAWESDTPGVPCNARSATLRVERIVSDSRPHPVPAEPPRFPRQRDPIQLLAERPWNRGRIEDASLQAASSSPTLGSLELYLKLGRGPDGRVLVERATYEYTGNREGAAYAALLSLLVEGQSLSVVRKITADDLHEFVGRQAMDVPAAELALESLRSALSGV